MIRRRFKVWIKSAIYRVGSILLGMIVLSYLGMSQSAGFIAMCIVEFVHYWYFVAFDLIWKRWIKYRLFKRNW